MEFEFNYISDAPKHVITENTFENVKPFQEGKLGGVWTTEKGTKLYWKITYTKGYFNQFDYTSVPRCYLLEVQRNLAEVELGADLTQPAGGELWILNQVGRRSKKQQKIAIDLAKDKLPQIVDQYSL